MENEVEVYDFEDRHWIVGIPVVCAGTLQRIKESHEQPIPGTGRRVPASAITPSGIYKPPGKDAKGGNAASRA